MSRTAGGKQPKGIKPVGPAKRALQGQYVDCGSSDFSEDEGKPRDIKGLLRFFDCESNLKKLSTKALKQCHDIEELQDEQKKRVIQTLKTLCSKYAKSWCPMTVKDC